jgi:hypothetical protein
MLPENDGTNACAFLAIAIGDAIQCDYLTNKKEKPSWDNLVSFAEEAINNIPSQINDHRDPSKNYDSSEAKSILEENGLLSANYELSEECLSAKGVFSEAGRKEILDGLAKNGQEGMGCQISIYTCGSYIFLIGVYNGAYFLIDTHPIGEDLGGNGNGILVTTEDATTRSLKLLVQWILKRLKASAIKGLEAQSLAWMTPKFSERGMISRNIINYISIQGLKTVSITT